MQLRPMITPLTQTMRGQQLCVLGQHMLAPPKIPDAQRNWLAEQDEAPYTTTVVNMAAAATPSADFPNSFFNLFIYCFCRNRASKATRPSWIHTNPELLLFRHGKLLKLRAERASKRSQSIRSATRLVNRIEPAVGLLMIIALL